MVEEAAPVHYKSCFFYLFFFVVQAPVSFLPSTFSFVWFWGWLEPVTKPWFERRSGENSQIFRSHLFKNPARYTCTKQTSRDHVDLDQTLHGKNRARNAAGITLLPVAQHRHFLWVIRLRPRCEPHIPTPLLLTPMKRLSTSFTLSYPTLCNSIFILKMHILIHLL